MLLTAVWSMALPRFLCPRYRAGLATRKGDPGRTQRTCFYALGIGLDLRRQWPTGGCTGASLVSMPSVSGWTCDGMQAPRLRLRRSGFYALGIGLDLRRRDSRADAACKRVSMPSVSGWTCDVKPPSFRGCVRPTFLCPRYRAGLATRVPGCQPESHGFVSMPSVSGWTCDGSQERGVLTCENGQRREHRDLEPPEDARVLTCQAAKPPLTCVRALPVTSCCT